MAKLTDRALKSPKFLKPASKGKRRTIMEAGGFGIRITDTGHASFVLGARFLDKKYTFRRIGDVSKMSLATARETARRWNEMMQAGIDPKVEEERRRQEERRKRDNTFARVFEDWISLKLSQERKGTETEHDVRREFLPGWKDRPITDISEGDVLSVIHAKRRSAPAQARNLLGHAKRFFQWAIDQRVYGLSGSPCEHLKPSKIVGVKIPGSRILSDEELFALWRAAGRLKAPYGQVYRLLMLNALRLNEVADAGQGEFAPAVIRALRDRDDDKPIAWRQLAPDELIWTIPAARMKARPEKARPHEVPLTAATLAVLESLPAPTFKKGSFLFSSTSGKLPVWISTQVKKRVDARMLRTLRALARRRGDEPAAVVLPRWTNHDIRRSVRSQLSRLKVTEEAREAVLAHARPGIKGVYDHHSYRDEKREALESWAARLLTLAESPDRNVIKFTDRKRTGTH